MELLYTALILVFPICLAALGVLLVPDAGKPELQKRTMYGRGGTITAATNASPSVLTFATPATPPPAGALIVISGATGNTAINTTAIVYNVSGATASIATVNASTGATTPVNGNGIFGGTCVWSLASMENWTLKLYKSNTTPAESSVAGSFTESTFTGYSSVTLTSSYAAASATWTLPTLTSPTGSWAPGAQTQVSESTYAMQSWTGTSTETCYGYFVVGTVSGTLLFAELFASSISIFATVTVNLTPRFGVANAS